MVTRIGLRRGGDAHDSTLLTIEEAAHRLGTSPRFVRRLVAARPIAFTRIGRHVRITPQDPAEFLAAGRVEPVTPPRR